MRLSAALSRRCVHTSTDDTRQRLRELLRETAQSVAVVAARLPDHAKYSSTSPSTSTYHGATLSSFASIALDPLPLVAFSLRVPSRMASALNTHVASSPRSPPSAHLIINLLSAAQPHLADRFARPDLYPRPFADPHLHWTPSQDDLPILSGSLGALSCRLISPSIPLTSLCESDVRAVGDASVREAESARGGERSVPQAMAGTGLASELFIARVLRIERVPLAEGEERDPRLYRLPLLYHRRRYTTVEDCTTS